MSLQEVSVAASWGLEFSREARLGILEMGWLLGRKGKISSESAMYCFRVLSSMLNDAVRWQIISINPCRQVRPPRVERRKSVTFDENSIRLMLNALNNEPLKYRVVVLLAIDSGLRLGELMGLKWSDVDFENFTLNVTKSNQALSGRGIFTKSPKNQSSVRKIALSENIIKLLRDYQQNQTEEKKFVG